MPLDIVAIILALIQAQLVLGLGMRGAVEGLLSLARDARLVILAGLSYLITSTGLRCHEHSYVVLQRALHEGAREALNHSDSRTAFCLSWAQ